jgi:hypothetical protein
LFVLGSSLSAYLDVLSDVDVHLNIRPKLPWPSFLRHLYLERNVRDKIDFVREVFAVVESFVWWIVW